MNQAPHCDPRQAVDAIVDAFENLTPERVAQLDALNTELSFVSGKSKPSG